MAAFDFVTNMYDVALKPRLLRSLIREHIPADKYPSWNPLELSRVISITKTHNLLSESFNESMGQKQIENWKSSIDSWVERILVLVSSSMPDKCWVGISLLGVTCQECSSSRFLASYSAWFHKLLSFIQPLADSHFVRMACCASISDLFTRLSGFPNVRKDGTSCAAKLIQPVLKLLNDDNSEDVWEVAVHLLCTLMTSFPFSIHRHYDSVEAAIVSKILYGGSSFHMLKKLAQCLALLPTTRGDEDSWSIMMRKILVAINDNLTSAFQGLEEENSIKEFVKLLFLPGKDNPPPLGSHSVSGDAGKSAVKKPEQSLLSTVSILMLCCSNMLLSSPPVKVNVPVRLLLALIERALLVDGSLPHISLPFMTAMQQESICSELPFLHSSSLQLLDGIIKSVGSQLLPHAASIVRLISVYFKMCSSPELRIKAYSITRMLLISMGVGMALCLSHEVINNAFVDLRPTVYESDSICMGAKPETPTLPSHKKRKHSKKTGFPQDQDDGKGLEEAPRNHPATPISLRIAALEAIDALLTVGGALRSEPWRPNVDNLLINMVADSFKEGWASSEKSISHANDPVASLADLQLAALRALLSSFLSSARFRPLYLSQGLELFCRGKQETGTDLAKFCAHALLTLEVLIHPRSLPLGDIVSLEANFKVPDVYTVGMNHNPLFGVHQMRHDALESDDDDLYNIWVENGKESDPHADHPVKKTKLTEEPSKASEHDLPELASGSIIQERCEEVLVPAGQTNVGLNGRQVEIRADSHHHTESVGQSQTADSNHHTEPAGQFEMGGDSLRCTEFVLQSLKPVSVSRDNVPASTCDILATETVSGRLVSDQQVDTDSGEMTLADNFDKAALASGYTLTGTSICGKTEHAAVNLEPEHSSPKDGYPNLVNADPDSDSD